MTQVFIFFGVIYTVLAVWYITINRKKNRTEGDVVCRRVIVELFSYLLPINLMVLLIVFHWRGWIRIWGGGEMDTSDFVALFVLIATICYFIIKPIRILTETIYTYRDTKYMKNFLLYLRPFNTDSNKNEKAICKGLKKYWPVYAIGNPSVVLPQMNAQRIYASDDNWQKAVGELIDKAVVILLRVGQTDGAIWEMQKLDEKQVLKTIFLVYQQKEYDCLKQILGTKGFSNFPALDFNKNNDEGIALYLTDLNEKGQWTHRDLSNKNDAKNLAVEYSDNRGIKESTELAVNGKKNSFWNKRIIGNTMLPYYRIRIFIWTFILVILAQLCGIIGYKVYNGNWNAFTVDKCGCMHLSKPHLITNHQFYTYDRLESSRVSPMSNFMIVSFSDPSMEKSYERIYNSILINCTQPEFDYPTASGALTQDPNTPIGITCSGNMLAVLYEEEYKGKIYHYITFYDPISYEELDNLMVGFINDDILREITNFTVSDNLIALSTREALYVYDYATPELTDAERIVLHKDNESYEEMRYAMSPDGTTFLLANNDKTISVYSTDDFSSPMGAIKFNAKGNNIIAYSADGTKIAVSHLARYGGHKTGETPFSICIYDALTFEKQAELIGHRWCVEGLAFNRTGDKIVTCSNDNTVRVWDTNTGEELHRVIDVPFGYENNISAAFINGDTKLLITAENGIWIVDLNE